MSLDLPTLLIVTVFVTALVGGLLLFAWLQNRRVEALAWWGGAMMLAALGATMLISRERFGDPIAIELANAVLFLGYGIFLGGMRRFEGRRVSALWLVGGACLWLAAGRVPAFQGSAAAQVIFSSLLSTVFTIASAWELWRGRREALMSRYPILAVLLLHAALHLLRAPLTLMAHSGVEHSLLGPAWVMALSFERLLYIIVMAFLLLGLTKERIEREQRLMARLDPLTGALNRRALFQDGARLLARDRRAGQPSALVLIDLDHFKRINDGFGHSAGDAVLRALCRVAADHFPGQARFARLGGEEFACLLPATTPALARQRAESARAALADMPILANRPQMRVTMSIGIATSEEVGHDLEALLLAADVNLYRAKSNGRNRVEQGAPLPTRAAA
jgi:diguanylate cyclase (GGDEF)-like protein